MKVKDLVRQERKLDCELRELASELKKLRSKGEDWEDDIHKDERYIIKTLYGIYQQKKHEYAILVEAEIAWAKGISIDGQ